MLMTLAREPYSDKIQPTPHFINPILSVVIDPISSPLMAKIMTQQTQLALDRHQAIPVLSTHIHQIPPNPFHHLAKPVPSVIGYNLRCIQRLQSAFLVQHVERHHFTDVLADFKACFPDLVGDMRSNFAPLAIMECLASGLNQVTNAGPRIQSLHRNFVSGGSIPMISPS
ncbi:hypothetical protein C8J56DRAFT_897064 [Mycena floridula]|nr:hypothetical protein C8J56DRAFT_897064 [Mycena floridula]